MDPDEEDAAFEAICYGRPTWRSRPGPPIGDGGGQPGPGGAACADAGRGSSGRAGPRQGSADPMGGLRKWLPNSPTCGDGSGRAMIREGRTARRPCGAPEGVGPATRHRGDAHGSGRSRVQTWPIDGGRELFPTRCGTRPGRTRPPPLPPSRPGGANRKRPAFSRNERSQFGQFYGPRRWPSPAPIWLTGVTERARDRITRLLAGGDLSDDNLVGALDLRAEAFDILDVPARAFADYTARNAIVRRVNARRLDREVGERRVDQARRLHEYFAAAPIEPWRAPAGDDKTGARTASQHVFLVGFPRSGTTLLERVFAAHPGVVTLSEVDHLGRVGRRFLENTTALDDLARLTSASADAVREVYWRGVVEICRCGFVGKTSARQAPAAYYRASCDRKTLPARENPVCLARSTRCRAELLQTKVPDQFGDV